MSNQSDGLEEVLKKYDLQLKKENRVDWNEGSKQYPRNWGTWSKWYTTIIVIWLEAYMTAISSAGTASSKEAVKEYKTTATIGYLGFVTVYLLGQTLGGIVLAPISEVFGRRTIYIIGTVSFGLASIVTGVPKHLAAAIIGRFFQGIAAAIPATVAFGNFDDLFDASTRIWVVYWYTLCGMAGLALGPIYSSYITVSLGWRWVYHIAAIISAASAIASCFMRESSAEQLLQKKVKAVRQETGNDSLKPDMEEHKTGIKAFFTDHIRRPLQFLFTEPLVTLCAVLCSIAFALLYGATESLTLIYTAPPFDSRFRSSESASLAFIPILIGEMINVIPRVYDDIYLDYLRKNNRRIKPESKIRSFAVACPALALGLWILAWTIPQKVTSVPWPISMIGLVLIGFAANDFSYVLFGYVTDSYGPYAASAVCAVSTSRTLAAAIMPLFVTFMYEGMGNNYATTLLAAIATLFCFTPWLFLHKGEALRNRSKFAAKGDDCLQEENEHLEKNDDKVGSSEEKVDRISRKKSRFDFLGSVEMNLDSPRLRMSELS